MGDLTHADCPASVFLTGGFHLQNQCDSRPPLQNDSAGMCGVGGGEREAAGRLVGKVQHRSVPDPDLVPGSRISLSHGGLDKKPGQ